MGEEEESRELEAYITYKILLNNSSTESANVSGLKVYYEDAFELVKSWISLEDERNDYTEAGEGKEELLLSKWKSVTYNAEEHGEYKHIIETDALKDKTLASGGNMYVYMKFKVKKDSTTRAIDTTKNYIIAEISSYTTEKGLIDNNSQPDSVIPTNYNDTFEYDTDRSPGFKLDIVEDERTMTGFVWEDIATEEDTANNEGVKAGNGTYDSNEEKKDGVTVQLIELVTVGDEEYQYIWQETKTGSNVVKYMDKDGHVQTKEVGTAEAGTYRFQGYIPGKYIVRFIYGENVSDSEIILSGQDYKSTKYNGEYETNKSHAKDNTDRRLEVIEAGKSGNPETIRDNTWMYADTRNDEGAIRISTAEKVHTDSINLGVIRRPIASLEIKNEIAGVRIVNKGVVLIDTEQGITDAAKYFEDQNTNSYWTIELDDEAINGATMEIDYEITITNNSEKDTLFNYFEGAPVTINGVTISGDAQKNYEILADAKTVYDLPEKLGYANQDDGWNRVDGADKLTLATTDLLGKMKVNETKTTTLKLSKVMAIGANDDLETANIAIVAEAVDDLGRSIGNSAESGTAIVRVTDPAGRNKDYTILWVGLGMTTIFVAGVILIKKKVLA
ncbi:MAG: hypothetical protein IKP28_01565 [Clostridia bacterium]|nr:hypothetical protein [Clostridia bacterium]